MKLHERIKSNAYELGISFQNVPDFVKQNLKYEFYEWQKKAFENFLTYEAIKEKQNLQKTHLMFNLATGSGKTLLMAGLILYYYQKGYRHFIFFVNQNNIVNKTENNFIDEFHNKYLFKEKIVIDNLSVKIEKVDTFSQNSSNLQIKFTTIQKLYSDIHKEKENQTTLEDLNLKNIVMLADEAHHLNATTSKSEPYLKGTKEEISSTDDVEKLGWEHMILNLILNKNNKKCENKNVLLEFSATIPEKKEVIDKYKDKTIYEFTLKEFLSAGYTKEINLISSTLDKKHRILQALLFSFYRHKIALKHDIANFKPVVLFRSKTIDESRKDFEEFLEMIGRLHVEDFNFLSEIKGKIKKSDNAHEQGFFKTNQILKFIENEKISLSEIVDFMQKSFCEKNVIITNSKTNTTKTEKTDEDVEKLLNNLEDKENHIRAIFTVNRLSEGWDVLNLYDIVRLYQGQATGGSSKKVANSTVQEKQLIGRGVRYFPFSYENKQKNKRKFDNNLEHELRLLEELNYYTYDEDSKYISELKKELIRDGYIKDNKIIKKYDLKDEFRKSEFYKNCVLWYNEKLLNEQRKRENLSEFKENFHFSYKHLGLEITEVSFDFKQSLSKEIINKNDNKTINIKFSDFNKHIFLKAMSLQTRKNPLFTFERLSKELKIKSIDDLQKDEFLGEFLLQIVTRTSFEAIVPKIKLEILVKFLDEIFKRLEQNICEYKGSEFKQGKFSDFFTNAKTKMKEPENEDLGLKNSLKEANWYVLDEFDGTSEEVKFMEFLKEKIGNLKQNYDEFYLLRNEEMYKIYDFKQGRGFMPDFILFLKGKENLNYQIFIEPKGDNLLEFDKWKEEFLEQICQKYGVDNIIDFQSKNYRLIGLPFFNEKNNEKFNKEFAKIYNKI